VDEWKRRPEEEIIFFPLESVGRATPHVLYAWVDRPGLKVEEAEEDEIFWKNSQMAEYRDIDSFLRVLVNLVSFTAVANIYIYLTTIRARWTEMAGGFNVPDNDRAPATRVARRPLAMRKGHIPTEREPKLAAQTADMGYT
jgi:hypothetical protein